MDQSGALCTVFDGVGPEEDALYKELWHACAGPLVSVPRQGELVFYFPQGHIEQVRNKNLLLLAQFLFIVSIL